MINYKGGINNMICRSCGNEINVDFTKIPKEVKTFDTKCEHCGSFVKIGNPNYVDPNKSVFTNYNEMTGLEMKKLINDKMDLLNNKFLGQLDDNEKENAGYFFWNCKMVLRNISMVCEKILSKYKAELTDNEIEMYSKFSSIINSDEPLWNNIGIVEETFKKLNNFRYLIR